MGPPTRRISPPVGPTLLVVICLIQAAWVGVIGLSGRRTFLTWDPSHHAMWGWLVWSDLASGNWLSFLYDSYRQVYWPPLHSWALAAGMLVLGPSLPAVGLVSLIAYAATGAALGALALRAEPRQGRIAALVAVGLWLTAGNLVSRYATEAYTEMPAIAATAGALLLLVRALERGTRSSWAWAGAGAMLVYLTKTDYGILLMLGTVAAMLLAARAGSQPEPFRKLVPWAVVIAGLAAVWFAYPPKILFTIAALTNRAQGPSTLSLAGLAFHLATLVRWSDGYLVWGVGLLALGLTALRPRTDLLRVLVLYVGLALLLHTVSQTKDEKHIVKVVPWLFLLIGVQAARWRSALEGHRRRRLLVGVLAIALVAGAVVRVNDFVRKTARPTPPSPGTEAILEAIAARIRPGISHLLIGGFNELSPHQINWTVLGNDPAARLIPDPMTKTGYTREAFQEKIAAIRRRFPPLGLLERGGEGPLYRIAYVLPKRRHEITDAPAIVDRMFRFDPDRVLVLAMTPGSPWNTEEHRQFNHPGAAFLPYLRVRADLLPGEVVDFPDQAVQLVVFDRR